MKLTDCFGLLVLFFWLLVGDVNCENTQRGYVQTGQAPMGVHNDNRKYKRWSEPPILRVPAAGYKTSSVDRGKSGHSGSYPAQEDHTSDSKSPQIQSHYYPVIPETQNSNVPASVTRRRSSVVYNRSRNKAFAFPDGKRIHQANSDFVPPRIHHARMKSTGRFPPIQVDTAPVGFAPSNRRVPIYSHSSKAGPNIKVIESTLMSESQKIRLNPSRPNRPEVSGYRSVFPKSFNRGRTTSLQHILQPIDRNTDSIVKGHSPGSNSAGKVDRQMSSPIWSPRVYSSDVMSEGKGYAHVRRLKPGLDKKCPQACQGTYSHDLPNPGFGLGVPASSERRLNLNSNSRGSQFNSWHPPPPDRQRIHVQGKFKPFQTRPTNDAFPAHTHSSDGEMAQTQTFAATTFPPGLNSTGITSSVVPSTTGEWSTKSASPMQTEGQDAALVTQASNHEGQSESSAEVGSSSE